MKVCLFAQKDDKYIRCLLSNLQCIPGACPIYCILKLLENQNDLLQKLITLTEQLKEELSDISTDSSSIVDSLRKIEDSIDNLSPD